jgi:hypothetical protein
MSGLFVINEEKSFMTFFTWALVKNIRTGFRCSPEKILWLNEGFVSDVENCFCD